jgi:hypothetical protein
MLRDPEGNGFLEARYGAAASLRSNGAKSGLSRNLDDSGAE